MINWSCKCPYRTTVLCRAGYWMRWRTVPSWRHDQDAGINLQVLVGWRNAFGHRDDIFTLQVWGYVHEVHNHWLRAFMAPSVNGQRIQEPAQQKLVPYGHFLCLTLSWMFLLGHLFMSSVVKALLKTEPSSSAASLSVSIKLPSSFNKLITLSLTLCSCLMWP